MLQSTGLREDALIKGANVTGLEGQKAGLGGGDGGGGLSSAFAGSLWRTGPSPMTCACCMQMSASRALDSA